MASDPLNVVDIRLRRQAVPKIQRGVHLSNGSPGEFRWVGGAEWKCARKESHAGSEQQFIVLDFSDSPSESLGDIGNGLLKRAT